MRGCVASWRRQRAWECRTQPDSAGISCFLAKCIGAAVRDRPGRPERGVAGLGGFGAWRCGWHGGEGAKVAKRARPANGAEEGCGTVSHSACSGWQCRLRPGVAVGWGTRLGLTTPKMTVVGVGVIIIHSTLSRIAPRRHTPGPLPYASDERWACEVLCGEMLGEAAGSRCSFGT
jgi:hypothetical protein